MYNCYCLFISLFYYISLVHADEDNWIFPDGFLIGAATSAYQIEGAWNTSDKGESVWDRFTHADSGRIEDGSNGDVAADSFHRYKEDVQLLKQLGVDFYRFSLSWTRILPTGYANVISKVGIKYYHDLLDELEKNDIKPFVTIYHWDHPQLFQDMGGWASEAMVDLFGDYARVVFKEYGHRVKFFFTINEPDVICETGYYLGIKAPGLQLGRYGQYVCAHNLLKAHARAYHIYNEEFRAQQKGKIGIVIHSHYYYSKYGNDTVSEDVAWQFAFGKYAHPIFSKEGDYPDSIKRRIAENSKFEGLLRSRLPTFSREWVDYIKGTSDVLGFNHYNSYNVEPILGSNKTIYENDDGLVYTHDPKWPKTPTSWLRIVPSGLLDNLRKIKDNYGDIEVYITENGIADTGELTDTQRMGYLYSYMKAMLTAIKTFGCNVKAYTVWSLLDNFEWQNGYKERYGLFHVDFTDENRTRSPKKSVPWLTNVIKTRNLQPPMDGP
ncbi:myrosinase 1-like [Copidosoma floridanum]|uniref:myrosinase 1-like n=1 Tax=Copidosoma floridanum TaxID=29053 RepID=UPI0006C9A00D|nr:myrosinase 1-like [Copidosoma floridanum]